MEQGLVGSHRRQIALCAVGSNQDSVWGTPRQTVLRAMDVLTQRLDAAPKLSRLYATPAFPAGTGPDFVNAAFAIESALHADALLTVLHAVEAEAKRTRDIRWGQRTLDLDLIALGDLVAPDLDSFEKWRELPINEQTKQTPTELILPHPRLQDRAFVLVPLADVAPDWMHPVLGKSVTQLLQALPAADRASVRVLE